MKVDLHPCFVLHQRAYRETSLILDVFSSGHGRVSLVAKGAKRGKNSQALLLQPARKLNLAWSQRSDMGTLSAVEQAGPVCALSGRRLFSCFYLNELLIRMLHKHESHPELFQKYEQALIQLESKQQEDRTLRIFEKNMLISLGYGLNLDQDITTGQAIDEQTGYFYRIGAGPMSDKPEHEPNIRISGKTLRALTCEDEECWDEQIAREAKKLFRTILDNYTGDKPLASRELYKSYLQNIVSN